MKMNRALRILVPVIMLFALVAAVGGLYPADGKPFSLIISVGKK